MFNPRRHPSGRPVRAEEKPKRYESIFRCPLEEPAIPRLRKPATGRSLCDAIGFHHLYVDEVEGSWARKKGK